MSSFAPHTSKVTPRRATLRLVPRKAQRLDERFEIRPIRPADAALIVAAREYTSDETYYRRFHTFKRKFTSKELRYLTEVDGHAHIALVAVERGAVPRLAAVARYTVDRSNPLEGELAVCVHDPFRRLGLGAEMLRRLRDEAVARGLVALRAMVQSDNVAMRQLLYHVFCEVRVDRCGGGEIEYLASLAPAFSRAA
jgi:acetyltransferase